ncbi:MAG: GGDEF domain-containing protein [Patescibacteria group bacterium]
MFGRLPGGGKIEKGNQLPDDEFSVLQGVPSPDFLDLTLDHGLREVLREGGKSRADQATIKGLKEKQGIDSLTGLLAEGEVESRLDKLITELNFVGEQRRSTLGAIMVVYLDLNDFKQINDQRGHAFGDQALVIFANRLRLVTRDLIFRLHGDEFLILMPIANDRTISDEVSKGIFKRLQAEINDNLSVEDLPISAAMGYIVLKKGERKSAKDLLHEADQKMYENKREMKLGSNGRS